MSAASFFPLSVDDYRSSLSPGSMVAFNVNDGFLEGILRGYMLGLLTRVDYGNLVQCDSLEDMKMHLQTTSFGDFLQNEPSPLHTTTIAEKATLEMVEEFEYLRVNASQPLGSFLDYITYGYMIDNVVLLITGTLHDRDIAELKEKCHPLGRFPAMASISAGQNVSDLYQEVLIDTPLGPYIANCLSEEDLNEMNIEIIRNTLYKAYLEDFDAYCTNTLGGVTSEVMHNLLQFEADRRSINITLNSFGTELTQDDRAKLYPRLGLLHPEGTDKLVLADDQDQVRNAVDHVPLYRNLFNETQYSEDKSLEDAFFEHEVTLNIRSFEQQFGYGVFYSYFKLKEQEIRNIVWIAECILQDQKSEINQYIPLIK
jgi:V-type H+-transporting ATPase subunit d